MIISFKDVRRKKIKNYERKKMKSKLFLVLMVLMMVLAACAPKEVVEPTEVVVEQPVEEVVEEPHKSKHE